jgi:hypothetical protein
MVEVIGRSASIPYVEARVGIRRGIIHSALTLRFALALLRPAKKKQKRRARAHFQLSTFSAHCGALLSFVFRCMKFGFWFVDTGGPGGDNEC